MNILAHIYLSGNDETLMLGNLMTDFIKGASIDPVFKPGIRLHHAIDRFTDTHPAVGASKSRLYPTVSKYAPVVVDVFYDHFLAGDWLQYHSQPLPTFAESVYRSLDQNFHRLPPKLQTVFPHMRDDNWLIAYQTLDGLELTLRRMNNRTTFDAKLYTAMPVFEAHYQQFKKDFQVFFPQLQAFVQRFIEPSKS